jgi:hypothetical protein
MATRRAILTALSTIVGTTALLAETPKFISTWKWMDAGTVSFAGKKVAALVISRDDSLRVAGEEALVRELSSRGLQMVATYRIVPRPELETAAKARAWYEKSGVEGVVAIRPTSKEKVVTYTPSMWVSASYGSLWSYYDYGWGAVYVPQRTREDTVVVVETLVFSVPRNQLVWAGVSETRNPKQLQQFVTDLVSVAAKEMEKQGLHRRDRR